MIWKDIMKHYQIQEIYDNAGFEQQKFFPRKLVEKMNQWINSSNFPSLFISGGVGTGKTYLTICLLRDLVQKRKKMDIRFIKSKFLFDSLLKESHDYSTSDDLLNKFSENHFLFIDDAGVEKYTERIETEWLTLIDKRIGSRKTTIISSNLSMEKFGKRYGERVHSRMNYFLEYQLGNRDIRQGIDPSNF